MHFSFLAHTSHAKCMWYWSVQGSNIRFVLLPDSKFTVKCTGQWQCGRILFDEALQFLKELMDTCVKSADVINGG